MTKENNYHVTYFHNAAGSLGWGSICITHTGSVTSETIEIWKEHLEHKNGWKNVAIMSFTKLDRLEGNSDD